MTKYTDDACLLGSELNIAIEQKAMLEQENLRLRKTNADLLAACEEAEEWIRASRDNPQLSARLRQAITKAKGQP